MWSFVRASLKVSTAALALLALSSAGPASGAMAAQFSVGVIEYNAKESQGGWTTHYGNVLAKQIKLIVDKISDKSNPSPVQFIALDQAKAEFENMHRQRRYARFLRARAQPAAGVDDDRQRLRTRADRAGLFQGLEIGRRPEHDESSGRRLQQRTIRRNTGTFAGRRKRMATGAGLTTSPISRTSPARRPCCS